MEKNKRVDMTTLYFGFGIAIVSLLFGGNDFTFDFVFLVSITVLIAGIVEIKTDSFKFSNEIRRFQVFLIVMSLFIVIFRNIVPHFIFIPKLSPNAVALGIDNRVFEIISTFQVIISLIGVIGLGIALWDVVKIKCNTES